VLPRLRAMVLLPADNPPGAPGPGPCRLRASSSAGSLHSTSTQLTSQLVGCPAYSFGKPRHRKGTFKIPVLDSRSPEYVPGITCTPGVGHYQTQDTVSRHDTKYGHPQVKRPPAFMFSNRSEPRDVVNSQPAHGSDQATTKNRFTDLTHCRSDSHLDVPGPGTYDIIHTEGLRHGLPGKAQSDMPAYTMRLKLAKIDDNPRKPPGPGPFEYETRHKHKVVNHRQPAWIVPKQKRVSEALLPAKMGTSEEVGPAKYASTIGLHSKFPQEEARHTRSLALKF